MEKAVINFSSRKDNAMFFAWMRGLTGLWKIEICRVRKGRSNRANAYYWACFVHPFVLFMQAQGEFITEEEAHFMFKRLFLKRDVINPKTGEVVGETVRSTTELDTTEFNIYLERVAQWLAEKVGIAVPEPSTYKEMEVAHA